MLCAMGRAIAYVRVSMEGGRGDDMISPEIQADAIERHCEQHGHRIVAILQDIDLSGRFWKRRKVEQAVQMIERGEADVLVVWKISRVSRNRADWNIAVDRVEAAGGRVESATEPLDTSTSSGRFARGVLAELAAFQSERIGEQWKEAHNNRIKRGLPPNAPQKFGYAKSKDGYTVDPETGPVLRDLYLRYIEGEGFTRLVALSGAHGGPKGPSGLRQMLDRGFGAGYIWSRGERLRGAHEGVVSEMEFQRYLAARRKRADRPRAENTPYAFSGIVFCECGKRMSGGGTGGKTSSGAKVERRYTCTAGGMADGGQTNTDTEGLVDAAVLEGLGGVADELDASASEVKVGARRADARPKLRRDLAKAADRLDKLTVRWLDGDVDKDTYERLSATLRAERDALQERLDALDEQEAVRDSGAVQKVVPGLLRDWPVLPPEVKRSIVAKLVGRITVPRGRSRWVKKPLAVTALWDQVG